MFERFECDRAQILHNGIISIPAIRGRSLYALKAVILSFKLQIAGPNGSAKSTFTRAIRESLGVPVIDPDLEARSLQPDAPEAAAIQGGRQAIKRARAYLENNESFAAETTLSGNTYLRMMAEAKQKGWQVNLPLFNHSKQRKIFPRFGNGCAVCLPSQIF